MVRPVPCWSPPRHRSPGGQSASVRHAVAVARKQLPIHGCRLSASCRFDASTAPSNPTFCSQIRPVSRSVTVPSPLSMKFADGPAVGVIGGRVGFTPAQPFRARPTAATSSSMVTRPFPSQSPQHWPRAAAGPAGTAASGSAATATRLANLLHLFIDRPPFAMQAPAATGVRSSCKKRGNRFRGPTHARLYGSGPPPPEPGLANRSAQLHPSDSAPRRSRRKSCEALAPPTACPLLNRHGIHSGGEGEIA